MLNRILTFYTKYFAVWVVLFAVVAYFYPAPFAALQPWNKWFFAVTVIIPLLAGFALRHYFRKPVGKILPVFPALSSTFIVFICALVVAINRDYVLEATGPILAAVIILNLAGMFGGYGRELR